MAGLPVRYEAFADRPYTAAGTLVDRRRTALTDAGVPLGPFAGGVDRLSA
ncbi:hypothetical protein AB0K14_00505 [Actinosynnema sp. NPDC050801]